jgi:hypothetical protein
VTAGGAVAVLALASAVVMAGPAAASNCTRVRALVFSETSWTVVAIDMRVCADPGMPDVPYDVRIKRNGVQVASGRGSAIYYCQGNDPRTYTGAGKTIRANCS